MANVLEMAIVDAILQLHAAHWSARQIAAKLELDRGTVRKYLKGALSPPKPAIPPAGSEGPKPATYPPAPGAPADRNDPGGSTAQPAEAKPAISPTGSGDRLGKHGVERFHQHAHQPCGFG
jgi:hypothetical protein